MSVSVSFQDFVIARLKTDAAVAGFVADRIYDGPPASPTFPYISMGSTDFRTSDADCIDSREETIQIDCWTRQNGRKWPCKQIVDAVTNVLRNASGDLSGGVLVGLRIEFATILNDPDGITAHGILQCTGLIDEAYDG